MSNSDCRFSPIRICGRSYLAFTLVPEPSVNIWLESLDALICRSPEFFVAKPVILDVSRASLSEVAVAELIGQLQTRNIRIMGIEGADPAAFGPHLPPVLRGGREAGPIEPVEPRGGPAPPPQPAFLLLDRPVRSGQMIVFPAGDVTVLGSVASGAEVIAGGSIHVYGTLRGRALAGSTGNPHARIFCSKAEPELLAIDGFYRTAEDIDQSLRNRPVQAWLQHDVMVVAPLNS